MRPGLGAAWLRCGLTPYSAEDEGEEGEGQDDHDHEAATVRAAAVDAALPLVPEFPFVAHFVRS